MPSYQIESSRKNVGYFNQICGIMSMVTRKVSNFPRMSATKRLESDGQYWTSWLQYCGETFQTSKSHNL
jgi:hypothetical protein